MDAVRAQEGAREDVGERLLPYIPRLLLDWPAGARSLEVEGTLVSADLSGFTRLSERLAALGREGAEELTTLLNGCFTGMIGEIERFGGDVLKFGGDALLILYRGAKHTERACMSTLAMRELIAQPLATSAGMRVRLRISQGVHAGSFSLFLVEGNHSELIVTGPGTTETVECEATANAGQILLSAAAAANVDRSWLGRAVDDRKLLRRIVSLEEVLDVAPPRAVDVTRFVPAAQREQIAVGAPSEHRGVTIGFVKFSHTDALLRSDGPDALADRLQELADAVATAEREYGVHWLASDVYPDGGKVILTAGAPVSMGDDEERMLRAARSILDTVFGLDLRIGVNAGPVFVGDLGSPTRRTFTVMGDAVNLAARLMQHATSGQLVASRTAIDRSLTHFETDDLEPFFVKGKTVPIHAAVVGAARERRAGIGMLPLTGRDEELALLQLAAASAREGAGRVVELIGEPGAGKTRLLEELRRREEKLALLTVQCGQYARTSPYFAVRPMLRELAGIAADASPDAAGTVLCEFVDDVAPELTPMLPLIAIPFDAAIPLNIDVSRIAPQFRRARAHEAVADLVTVVVRDPTLLLVEDLHWVDDASRDLLRELSERAALAPWLLVLSRRPGLAPLELDGENVDRITLGPLDPGAALALLVSAAGDEGALAPHEWTTLVERAGGNPLFAIELAAAARSQGSADALADSVESLVTSKIDTLPARDRLLLRESSVLGSVVDAGLLADALGRDDVRDPSRWRSLDDFVVREGPTTFRFRHAIHQQVAYGGLSYRRRREVHGRAARAIEQRATDRLDAVAGLLSTHYFRAGEHGPSWQFSVLAGDDARGQYANIEAAEFYRRALDSARTLADVDAAKLAEVAEALGDVCDLSTRYDESLRAYAFARKHRREDAVAWAELLRKEGRMYEREGRYTQALRSFSRGVKCIETLDTRNAVSARAALFAAYGSARFRQGRLRDALQWARRSMEQAERAGDQRALAHALRTLEVCLEDLGDPERLEYRGRALPLFEELDDQIGIADELSNLGVFALGEGRLQEALDLLDRARTARQRAGDVVGEAAAMSNAAEALLDQGRADEAMALLEPALHVWRSAGHPLGVVIGLNALGRACALLGDADRAFAVFEEAADSARALNAIALVHEIGMRKAEALVTIGRDEEACALAEELIALGDDAFEARFVAMLYRLRGWALLRLGRIAEAEVAIDAALARAEAIAVGYEIALALRGRAELRRRRGDERAAADDARAAAMFDDLGMIAPPQLLLS